ncbi:MAG: alpha/beta hydrolase [Ignavibacteriales bacterium]|nr:alpha/beta hydrolase [Ignavibacteriales bacterium]
MKNKIMFTLFMIILVAFFSSDNYSQQQNVLSKDGVKISFFAEGKEEPALIFVHGWSCDKTYWENQVNEFSPKYKVVTIDLAGHGESGTNRINYTMELFGEDVAAVVNELGLKKVILIGHSMSGAVVIEAARILKNKVVGLVGADTFQNLGETMTADQIEPFLKPFKENFSAHTKEFVKSMFPPSADPDLVKKVSDDMASAPPEVAISAMENMFKDNAIEALKEINVPIIGINCDRYPVHEEENRKFVKSYELKMMKGIGHFVMLEDPAQFNRLLSEAVAELTK